MPAKIFTSPRSAFDVAQYVTAEIPMNLRGEALAREIIDRLATKFVEEHGDVILAQIDAGIVKYAIAELVADRIRATPGLNKDKVNASIVRAHKGLCPECSEPWQSNLKNAAGWSFAPEWREAARERGIALNTGHKVGCVVAKDSH